MGAVLETSYFFLNTMYKVKVLKMERIVCQERAYLTASLCNAELGNI